MSLSRMRKKKDKKTIFRLKTVIFSFVAGMLCLAWIFPFGALADINEQINYQGKLSDASGNPVPDGSYDMVFRIYDASSGGNLLWTGTYTAGNGNAVAVADGLFSVLLGSGTGNALSLDFDSSAYYLGVTVGTDSEMTPRKRLASVSQAFNAKNLKSNGYINIAGTPVGTGVSQGTAYINPSSATAGYTLFGVVVGGVQKLKLTEGGDLALAGAVTSGAWNGSTIGVAYGGTGVATFTSNGVLYGNGTGAVQATSAGTNGQVFLGVTSGAPVFATLSGDASVNNTGTLTIANDAVTGAKILDGTIKNVDLHTTNAATNGYLLSYDNASGGFTWISSVSVGTGDIASVGSCSAGDCFVDGVNNALIFEGLTNDTSEITLQSADPTADRTLTLPDATGTLATVNGGQTFTSATWNGAAVAAQYGGTGINGASAGNGTLLIGNGSGYALAALTEGSGITVTNGAGSITIASTLGASVDLASEVTGTLPVGNGGIGVATLTSNGVLYGNGTGAVQATSAGTNGQVFLGVTSGAPVFATLSGDASVTSAGVLTVAGNAVALATDTTGNYVQSVTNGSGISGGDGGSEGAALTLALGALTSDWSQTGTFDIVLDNSSSELKILEGGTGPTLYGIFDVTDLTVSSKTYTFPNATGTVVTSGNLSDITAVGTVTSGIWNGSAVGAQYGGTGFSSYAVGDILYASATTALSKLAVGTDGQCLISNGTIPTWGSCGSGIPADSLDFTDLADALTLDASTDIAVSGTNVLSVTNSGTGSSFVVNDAAGDATPFVIDASGNVGIGDASPSALLSVGSGGLFRVNSSGAITAVTGYSQSSGTLSLTSANTTQTTTSSIFALNGNSLTSGTGFYAASSTLSSGSLMDLAVTGTAAASNTQKVLNVSVSGANATATQTTYGGYFSNTHTGTSSTNVAGYFTASGGSSNYGLIVGAGNVGIGDATPAALLTVGDGDLFQVNSLGAIAVAAGITSSGTITFSGLTTNGGILYTNGSGVLAQAAAGTDGQLLLGVTSSVPAFATMSGDATITNAGVLTIGTGAVTTGKISDSTILAADFSTTNVATDGYLLAFDNASGGFTWTSSGSVGSGDVTSVGSCTTGDCFVDGTNHSLVFEGSTGDTSETTLQSADPTGDRTLTLPDATGTLISTGNLTAITTVGTITSGTWNGSTIGIAYGGTNATSVGSAGSVPYSSGSAYAFSAVGTSGQALVSGGSGAPTWFAPTAGSVLFAGTSGILQQDNANFFWDDSNNRLGIGTTGPSSKIDIFGTSNGLRLSYDASNYATFSTDSSGDLSLTSSNTTEAAVIVGDASAVNASVKFDGATQDYYAGLNNSTSAFQIGAGQTIGTTPYVTISSSGSVGIGTTTISANVHSLATTEQLRLGYDASNYASFTVGATGNLTTAPSGGTLAVTGALTTTSTINGLTVSSGTISSGTWNGSLSV
jgi:hypothetical protein